MWRLLVETFVVRMQLIMQLVFVMLSRLFIAALWSPTGKRLTSWRMFMMFNCVFVTFPCAMLGQGWCLIVSIPDLCHLSYFLVWFSGDQAHITTPQMRTCTSRIRVENGLKTCAICPYPYNYTPNAYLY